MTYVKNFHRISRHTHGLGTQGHARKNMRSKAFNFPPSYPLEKRDCIDRDETCFSNVPLKVYRPCCQEVSIAFIKSDNEQ